MSKYTATPISIKRIMMQTKMIHFLYVVFFFRKSLELRAKYIYTYELYYTNFDVYLIDC